MPKRARAWDHFDLYNDSDGRLRAQCKYCDKNYASDSSKNGTSSLNNHMKLCESHQDNICKSVTDSNSNILKEQAQREASSLRANQENVTNKVLLFLVSAGVPLTTVKSKFFRDLCGHMCPQYVIPSTTELESDCMKLYLEKKEKLNNFFKGCGQGVSLTFDIWTSKVVGFPFMCLKAHFIDDDWKLQTKALNFTGYDIGDAGPTIEECLNQWHIDRVFTVTLDYTSSNDPTVEYLRNYFASKGTTTLGGKYLHMRCVTHVINIVVKDEVNRVNDIVERIGAVVRRVSSSMILLKKFKHFVRQQQIKDTKKALLIDVPDEWDSVYMMLEGALIFRSVFEMCAQSDASMREKYYGPEGQIGFLTEHDWVVVKRMVKVLQHFYALTSRISCSQSVTSSTSLDDISDTYSLLREWMSSDDMELVIMAKRIKMKFNKYWGDVKNMNMVMFVAVMLDPRRKVKFALFALNNIYGEAIGQNVAKLAENAFCELFNEYKKIYASKIPSSSSSSTSELEVYLNEKIVKDKGCFDLTDWWKIQTTKYPILSRLARDVLAVPISSIDNKHVYGTVDHVIDDYRDSLTPEMMEALFCTQDWLSEGPLPSDDEDGFLDDIEDDVENLSV